MKQATPEASNILIVTVGTAGDIYPLLRIALALQARGHSVRFLGPRMHAIHAQKAGVPFQAIVSDADYLEILNNPDLWHSRKGVEIVLRSLSKGAQRMVEVIAALPEHENSILLAHPLAVPGAAMAKALWPAMRIVAFYLAPSNLRTIHDPLTVGPLSIPRWTPLAVRRWLWRHIDARMIDPMVLPELNALRHSMGLAPVRHLFAHVYAAADLSLTLFPRWYASPRPDWPQPLHTGYFQLYDPQTVPSLSLALEKFLASGTPPIVFTHGSGNVHASAYFKCALQAAGKLGRRAIFLTPYREQLPDFLPEHILWQDYVPLRVLLPSVAILVHHGGIGTTAEALRAGVPQLVVPLAHDQFDNAMRVRALGVGDSIAASHLSAGKMVRRLNSLLSSSVACAHCDAVAARFIEPEDEEALCRAIVSA